MQASSVVAARHTIVTGGSSGIGLALVRRLAGLGARTSVIALDDEDLVRLRQSQPSATCIGADVGDRDQAQAAVSACVDTQGPCDLLFTCAGIIRPGYFMEIPDEEFERQMRVNYFGTLWPIRAVVPPMIAGRSGSIVAISSFGGLMRYSATPPTSRPNTPCARCAKHCGSNSRRTAFSSPACTPVTSAPRCWPTKNPSTPGGGCHVGDHQTDVARSCRGRHPRRPAPSTPLGDAVGCL